MRQAFFSSSMTSQEGTAQSVALLGCPAMTSHMRDGGMAIIHERFWYTVIDQELHQVIGTGLTQAEAIYLVWSLTH